MNRFFAEVSGETVRIIGEDAHHITHVLRLQKGEKIVVCDGRGVDYQAELTELAKESVSGRVLERTPSAGEPELKVTLFQGIPKGDKLEFVIQKAVELGVTQIVPVQTRRCIVKVDAKKQKAKTERWNKIAQSAAKQAGRGILPQVMAPASFLDAVEQMKGFDLPVICYEEEKKRSIKQALCGQRPHSAAVFIGPEGGIAPEEAAALREAGFQTVSLGSRILRTETAPIAVLAMLFYEYEQ